MEKDSTNATNKDIQIKVRRPASTPNEGWTWLSIDHPKEQEMYLRAKIPLKVYQVARWIYGPDFWERNDHWAERNYYNIAKDIARDITNVLKRIQHVNTQQRGD